jgi:septal ring factor EnvC (AmiA/AmiB activator)
VGQSRLKPVFIAGALICTCASFVAGQTSESRGGPDAKPENQLKGINQQLERAAEREKQINRQLSALEREAREISRRLIDLAAKTQTTEEKLTIGERKIADLNDAEQELVTKLSSRQQALGELLVGLQRLERDPPPPLVAHPKDALAAIRSATLFAAIIPAIKSETTAIRADLSRLKNVRASLKTAEQDVHSEQAALDKVRNELNALLDRKKGFVNKTRKELAAEKIRTAALARKAKNLNQLLSRIKKQQQADRIAREKAEAEKTEAERRKLAEKRARLLRPKVAFSQTKGKLPLPVKGNFLRGFNQKDSLGSRSQGIFLSTRKTAQIVAPASGVVEYAGKFRSYGQLLILNVGEGYRMLLGGLGKIDVVTGQKVLAGEPLGLMGEKPARGTLITAALDVSQPVLYIEFRKNGGPIDSSSWWLSNHKRAQK